MTRVAKDAPNIRAVQDGGSVMASLQKKERQLRRSFFAPEVIAARLFEPGGEETWARRDRRTERRASLR